MKHKKPRILVKLSFVVVLLSISIAAIFHIQIMNNMQRWGIEKTEGILNITPKMAELLSVYVLFLCLTVFAIYTIYLILNQR